MKWSHQNVSQHCHRLFLFEIHIQLNPLQLQTETTFAKMAIMWALTLRKLLETGQITVSDVFRNNG